MEGTMPDTGDTTTQATDTTDLGAMPNDVANLGEPGKRAIAAERDARKAAEEQAKSLQAQLDEIKKSQMSDLEKAQATAQEHQQAAEKAQSEALRWRIAARHGISDEDAETFLTGSDEASLTRQAQRLSAMSAVAPATPKPDRTQGGTGQAPALNSDALTDALKAAVGAQ